MAEVAQKEISDREFVDAVNICLEHYSVGDIANTILVSTPTVRLWSQGKNLPHQAMRPSALRGILGTTEIG